MISDAVVRLLISIFLMLTADSVRAARPTGPENRNTDLHPVNSMSIPHRNGAKVSPRYTDIALMPSAKPRPPREYT